MQFLALGNHAGCHFHDARSPSSDFKPILRPHHAMEWHARGRPFFLAGRGGVLGHVEFFAQLPLRGSRAQSHFFLEATLWHLAMLPHRQIVPLF